MRHFKLRAKVIWLLLTNQYTCDVRSNRLLLWSDEQYCIYSNKHPLQYESTGWYMFEHSSK
jgi:hypothetical protein